MQILPKSTFLLTTEKKTAIILIWSRLVVFSNTVVDDAKEETDEEM